MRKRVIFHRFLPAALVLTAVVVPGVLVPGVVPGIGRSSAADAAPRKPVISISPATVVQQDPVTISGATVQSQVTIYHRLYGHAWTRLGSVRAHHGRFSYRTRPVANRTNLYRTSAGGGAVTSRTATARSVGCAPLTAPGDVATWVQDLTVQTTLTTNWTRLICSAAPGSTITMAEMYVYENSATVSQLMSALRAVHYYRGVHVRVLVQRGGYYPGAQWASLKRHFAFAEVHYCTHGCHSSDPNGHAHTKFMVLSETIFGRSAVVESSANWSQEQLDGQRQSGVYVYGNDRLRDAFLQEWASLSTRSVLAAASWRSAGDGIWYAFDPRPAETDPISSELHTLTCQPGDSIGVVDTLLTRTTLVAELDRLAQAGCSVHVLIDPIGSVSSTMTTSTRTVVVHDKFLVIDAHSASTDEVRQEVVHGSENFSTGSMTLSDQQLLLLRRPDVYASYQWWFAHLWQRSAALPPAVPPPPASTPPITPLPPDPDVRRNVARSSGLDAASSCGQPVAAVDDDAGVCTNR